MEILQLLLFGIFFIGINFAILAIKKLAYFLYTRLKNTTDNKHKYNSRSVVENKIKEIGIDFYFDGYADEYNPEELMDMASTPSMEGGIREMNPWGALHWLEFWDTLREEFSIEDEEWFIELKTYEQLVDYLCDTQNIK